jgi:hypothetical protein
VGTRPPSPTSETRPTTVRKPAQRRLPTKIPRPVRARGRPRLSRSGCRAAPTPDRA